MSPLFYLLAMVIVVCTIYRAIIEYRIRKISTEIDFQRKEVKRFRREIAGALK